MAKLVGLTPGKVEKYKPNIVKDDPEGATFHLASVDGLVMAHVNDIMIEFSFDNVQEGMSEEEALASSSSKMKIYEWATEMCRFGLTGWSNFKDAEGNDIVFKPTKKVIMGQIREVASVESLGRIPPNIMQELAQKIQDLNSPKEEELKNSETE